MNQTVVQDFTDVRKIHPELDLFLKPIARINITVNLPKVKVAGQTISNWELQVKLKDLCAPLILKSFSLARSTNEYIKFDVEVGNKTLIKSYIKALNSKAIKLPGYSEVLKVSCVEAKSLYHYPTRQEWDEFFGDSNKFDETQPGERPDTVYLSQVPCQFFSTDKAGTVNPEKIKMLFSAFGKVRNVDVPMLDPYQADMQQGLNSSKKSFTNFTYDQQLLFDVYIQYENYMSFANCMSSFKNMKLLMKENEEKAVAVNIKVDFDKTKHLSNSSIENRKIEKENILMLQKKREEQKRKEKERIEEKEKKRIAEEKRQLELKRLKKEEKRKKKQEEKDRRKAQAKAMMQLARDEIKLEKAMNRLKATRLVTTLMCRLEQEVKEAQEKERLRRLELLQEQKKLEEEREKERQEYEIKSRILKRKLEEKYKNKNKILKEKDTLETQPKKVKKGKKKDKKSKKSVKDVRKIKRRRSTSSSESPDIRTRRSRSRSWSKRHKRSESNSCRQERKHYRRR